MTLKLEKDKALSDDFISKHRHKLCGKCTSHIDNWSHLYAGKERTHIMTNEEINFLIYETNKEDLLDILKVRKLKIRLKKDLLLKQFLKNMTLKNVSSILNRSKRT